MPGSVRRLAPPSLLFVALVALVAWSLGETAGIGLQPDDWELLTPLDDGTRPLLHAVGGGPAMVPLALTGVVADLGVVQHPWLGRVLGSALHALCVVLAWRLVSRRVGIWLALVPALILVVLPWTAGDALLFSRVGVLCALAAGLTAWLCLDHDDPPSDLWAAFWLVVATASSPVGVAILAAVAGELAWRRAWWHRWWVPVSGAVPVAFWAAFHVSVQDPVGPLVTLLALGCVVALGAWSPASRLPPRAVGAFVGLIALTTVSGLGGTSAYPASVLVVAAVSAGLRWRRLPRPAYLVLAGVVVAVSVVSTVALADRVDDHRDGGGQVARAIGVLHVAGAAAAPSAAPEPRALRLTAGGLRAIERRHGRVDQAPVGRWSDEPLRRVLAIAPQVTRVPVATTGVPLELDERVGGTRTVTGSKCQRLVAASGPASLTVRPLRGEALLIHLPRAAAATVRLQRFSPTLGPPASIVGGGSPFLLRLPRDASATPWRVQVRTAARFSLCAARG